MLNSASIKVGLSQSDPGTGHACVEVIMQLAKPDPQNLSQNLCNRKGWCRVLAALSTALAFAIANAEIRDVRGYEIKDSGFIGRASGISGDIYWLDNNKIIFIGAKPGEIVEPTPGLRFPKYKLYLWDEKTGATKALREGRLFGDAFGIRQQPQALPGAEGRLV